MDNGQEQRKLEAVQHNGRVIEFIQDPSTMVLEYLKQTEEKYDSRHRLLLL